ncbi:MAG: diguanylate cyclase [Ruminococcus sp.]|nr:diguanylate cyclase [Ruminococcus sp.]
MSENTAPSPEKDTVLIADDSELNREILVGILGDNYNYILAEDGVQAIEKLSLGMEVSIVLLDVNMPNMDGFGVLKVMNNRHWLDEIPVIIISADSDADCIKTAYELGASDYITRPFNAIAVNHRIQNMLALYSRQKQLVRMIEEQVFEREKINNLMINIFSHAIESRNQESGSHTIHVQTITKLLLNKLVRKTGKYNLTKSDIALISSLSALHDLGKIDISETVLNKPDKLSPEEWEIMKSHTITGDRILDSVSPMKDSEKLMRVAHEIVRSHHERWDGSGYPDGLAGDEIPISAQVVALADVYDALTSERCYKKAVPHKTAIRMIADGKCGAFNPILIECLCDADDELYSDPEKRISDAERRNDAIMMTNEVLAGKSLVLDGLSQRVAEVERIKKEFFADECKGIVFEYFVKLKKVTYRSEYEGGKTRQYFVDEKNIRLLGKTDIDEFENRLAAATRETPEVDMKVLVQVHGDMRWHRLHELTAWPTYGEGYAYIIGHFEDIHDSVVKKGLTVANDAEFTVSTYETIKNLFGTVRIVDPVMTEVVTIDENGNFVETGKRCYQLWGREECCENCSSKRALEERDWMSKLEVGDNGIFAVLSRQVALNGRELVMEILFPMDENLRAAKTALPSKANFMLMNFYRDSLTRAYSRVYLEDFLPNLQHSAAVAIADADNFKSINDKYGHQVGDVALKAVSNAMMTCLRKEDVLIRYGGDEFLLLFKSIEEDEFEYMLKALSESVASAVPDGYPEIKLGISIGGAYHVFPLARAISVADSEMYKNKQNRAMKGKENGD